MRPITFDQFIAGLFVLPILLVLMFLYVIVLISQGRPFLHRSERMRSSTEAFTLYKIRTMVPNVYRQAEGVLGGDQACRVTPIGRILRRTRLDELPQIFNVIKGDIRFIGPRPPLRRHVEARSDLFDQVLSKSRPGITGLATVFVHEREERLLSACLTEEQTEEVYLKRCLPVKVRLDLIYAQNQCFGLNLLVLWLTLSRLSRAAPTLLFASSGSRPKLNSFGANSVLKRAGQRRLINTANANAMLPRTV